MNIGLEIFNLAKKLWPLNRSITGDGTVDTLKSLKRICHNLKIKNIFLEVSNLNKEAIRLYQKLGFKKNGLRQKYYQDGSDAILYQMEI